MQMCVCGGSNSDAARFCAACGAKLAEPLPKCRACGAEVLPGASFCIGCGASVNAEGATIVPKTAPPPAPEPSVWDIGLLVKPITTLEQAKAMAQVGAAGAALIALYLAVTSFNLAGAPAATILVRAGLILIHAACAYALFRGLTVGGLASLLLHLINILAVLESARVAAAQGASLRAGDAFMMLLLIVVIPAALVSGIRGCMTWNRFRRGEIQASPRT